MSPKALIVGGAGEMGRWYARFLADAGWDVAIHDVSPDAARVAREGGWAHDSDLSALDVYDVALVSVPIDRVEDVVANVAPRMREGSLLCDITSVKVKPVEAMAHHAPAGVEVIGSHPLFGPTMPTARGQTVILTPLPGRSEAWLPRLLGVYARAGVKVEVLSPEEHDRLMAVVQGLTHFVYIALGGTLRALDFNVAHSRRFTSPIYDIFLDLVGRILAQNQELYALIQTNLDLGQVHAAFQQECHHLAGMVADGDLDGVERYMLAARRHFGDVNGALRRSERLIARQIDDKVAGAPGSAEPENTGRGRSGPREE